MVKDFYRLIAKNNYSLENKRLRLMEYVTNPLLNTISTITYRILNSRNNGKLRGNITPEKVNRIILKNIITSELLHYSDAVNAMDLFNALCRVSAKGPQSIVSKSSSVSNDYRNVHPSYIGNFSLVTTSASDPGMSFMMTPFVNLNKDKTFNFKERENL